MHGSLVGVAIADESLGPEGEGVASSENRHSGGAEMDEAFPQHDLV